ncbi:MAG: hypothetical protein NTV39_00475 [Candidatus Saccharibacteria bacterium]|nr:hypothetical protein [Candidatus Saccharibacteria bacterium]
MSEIDQIRGFSEKMRDRYGPAGTLLSEQAHEAFTPWGEEMQERSHGALVLMEHDEERYPEQSIFSPVADMQGVPDEAVYEGVKSRLIQQLGEGTYYRLLDQVKNQPTSSEDSMPLLKRIALDKKNHKNIMVPSPHTTYIELAIINNLLFIAEQDMKEQYMEELDMTKEEMENSGNNLLVMSKFLSRMSYYGQAPTLEIARLNSNVLQSCPISESSEKHKIPPVAAKIMNALFVYSLRAYQSTGGMELHVALTGRQVIWHPGKGEGKDDGYYEIPKVARTSAGLTRCVDDIVPITVVDSPVTSEWEMAIDNVIDAKKELADNNDNPLEVVQPMYKKMAGHIETFTDKEVDYPGSPRQKAIEAARKAIHNGFQ